MFLCDVVNQLLNQDGFAYTGAAEQTDFTALCIRADEVNDLDAGFQNIYCTLLLLKGRSRTMDFPFFFGLYRFAVVNRLTEQVEHASQRLLADRYANRSTGIDCLCASNQTVRRAHRDAAGGVVADVLCHLSDDGLAVVIYFQCIEKVGKLSVCKFYIKYRSDNLRHGTHVLLVHAHFSFLVSLRAPQSDVIRPPRPLQSL